VRYFLARYGAELGIKEPSIHPEAMRFFPAAALAW
jgi:hypothetical protein